MVNKFIDFAVFWNAVKSTSRRALTFLQAVDVLRVRAQQQALEVQRADEVVDVVGPVAAGIQRLGQREEGLRVVGEVVDVEDGLWVGNAVLLQVGVESRSWSPDAVKHSDAHTSGLTGKIWRSA